MGKNKNRVWVCGKYYTEFAGFKVPVGSVYGKINGVCFVCTTPKETVNKLSETFHCYVMNPEWGDNSTTEDKNSLRWNYCLLSKTTGTGVSVAQKIREGIKTLGFIPKVGSWNHPQEKAILEEKRRKQALISYGETHVVNPADWEKVINKTMTLEEYSSKWSLEFSELPQRKQHPQPQFGQKSGCYSQSRVDGRGYDISWEEDIIIDENTRLYGYNGCPVEFIGSHVSMAANTTNTVFMPFGEPDPDVHKDHLKINQTKIRPEKTRKDGKIRITRTSVNGTVTVIQG